MDCNDYWGIEFARKKDKDKRISIYNDETGDNFIITMNLEGDILKHVLDCLKNGLECKVTCSKSTLTISKYHMVIEYFDIPITFKAVLSLDKYKDVLIKGYSSWLE